METKTEPFFSNKTIHVFAFDFDKCVFNALYLQMIEHCLDENPNMTWTQFLAFQKEMIDSNNVFLLQKITDKVIKHKDAAKFKLVSSSGRQSYPDDLNNRYTGPVKTGSSFQALIAIKELIEAKLSQLGEDKKIKVNYYLLADLYANLYHGKSYNALLEMQNFSAYWNPGQINEIALSTCSRHPNWIFDNSKFTIVYSHIHELFSLKQNLNTLRYYMLDDRLDILENLQSFILKNPQILPKGCVITLVHYCGEQLTKIGTILGEGPIDRNYEESVKKMLAIAGAAEGDLGIFNVLETFNHSENLEVFLEWQSVENPTAGWEFH